MNREESIQRIIDAIKHLHPESDAPFEPLGRDVAEDYATLVGPEMQALVDSCKGCAKYLPLPLQEVAEEFKATLDLGAMSAYCSAISSYISNALLHTGDLAAIALIKDIGESPVVEIYTPKGSLLAREAHLTSGGTIRYGVAEIARHISQRCGKAPRVGEVVWRCVARCLPQVDDAVFPGIDVTSSKNGLVTVRARPLKLEETRMLNG